MAECFVLYNVLALTPSKFAKSISLGAVLVTQWCGQLSTINEEEIRKNMQEIISLVENKGKNVFKAYSLGKEEEGRVFQIYKI